MKMFSFIATIVALLLCGNSCQGKNGTGSSDVDTTSQATQVPQFNADSAYACVKAQCDFGPRVPGTADSAKYYRDNRV